MRKIAKVQIIRFILVLIIAFTGFCFFSFKKSVTDTAPIRYRLIKAEEHKGGRGKYYTLTVAYQNQLFDLSITSRMYNDVLGKQYPELYYNSHFNDIISKWQVTQSKRMIGIEFFFLITTFIPVNKISMILDKKIAKKNKSNY